MVVTPRSHAFVLSQHLQGKTRGRAAAVGAAIGGVGLAAGLAFYLAADADSKELAVPAFTLWGAGIGAGLGVLVGKRQRTLLYVAP